MDGILVFYTLIFCYFYMKLLIYIYIYMRALYDDTTPPRAVVSNLSHCCVYWGRPSSSHTTGSTCLDSNCFRYLAPVCILLKYGPYLTYTWHDRHPTLIHHAMCRQQSLSCSLVTWCPGPKSRSMTTYIYIACIILFLCYFIITICFID